MYQIVMLIHVFAAVCIVALVLVQQGKGASVGAAFGSGASQTVFGSRGSGSFLFRLTMGLAALFFLTSLGMNYMTTRAYKQEKNMTVDMALPALPQKTAAPAAALPVTTKAAPKTAAEAPITAVPTPAIAAPMVAAPKEPEAQKAPLEPASPIALPAKKH